MQISYLVTMDQALNYLSSQGLNVPSNINYENNIKIFRAAAHRKIRNYLGYEFIDTTYTDEIYSSSGGYFLYLNNRPITSLDAIKLDNVAQTKTDYIIVDETHLYFEDMFTKGYNNYKISYKAGWTQANMPGDIRLAALQLIALYNGQTGGGGTVIGKSSVSNGQGVTESINPEAEKEILESLSGYLRYDRI